MQTAFDTPELRRHKREAPHNLKLVEMVINWFKEMEKLETITPPPEYIVDWYLRWKKRVEQEQNENKLILPTRLSTGD